jgi:hypothetical protein
MLEVMGSTNAIVVTQEPTTNGEIDSVERLFIGDDSTSVGTLFTNNQSTPTRHNSNASTRNTSTTMTMEDVERNMHMLSSDMAVIKSMMQKLVNSHSQSR